MDERANYIELIVEQLKKINMDKLKRLYLIIKRL